MCGIAGIFSPGGKPVNPEDVARMNAAIAHRGPDGEGVWQSADGRCVLGHRRLAIIDVDARANQPMLSGDGRYAIVFNGEIYNFLEVRADLEAKGHIFRTESDTEVILAAWREWGAAMQPRFNGMWAIAIYDNLEKSLFLSRDRFGVKPLLYSHTNDVIAFGSEMRALLALPWLDRTFDQELAARAVFDPFNIEGGEHSIRRSIRRLPAGHNMTINAKGVRVSRWWRMSDHLIDPPASLAEAADMFRERFYEAVRIRMRSDVPIGTCLSGGFDSSSIVATMRHIAEDQGLRHDRENKSWRHAFVATFPGLDIDESEAAKVAAAYAGIDAPHLFDFSSDDPTEHIDAVLDTMEDVFITLPTAVWKTYRAVRDNGVLVSLDGHGADEMMGGYRQGNQRLRFMLGNLIGSAVGRAPIVGPINRLAKAAVLRRSGDYHLRQLVPPALQPTPFDDDPMPSHWGLFSRRLYGMFQINVLPTLLRNFDRLSMAHGVEVRSPYLDWRVAQLVLSLPDEMKSDPHFSKLVAREALRDRMPESIRAATRKVGFGSQMPDWLNGKLGAWAAQMLSAPNPAFDDVVNRATLLRRIDALNASKKWNWISVGRLWPYIHLYRLLIGR
ncbi:asparagine synthase (glutamine-hydrolyzing) [Sphingomonas sp.]|uniref:asparagine synthase (glutamine-hydrolyzing) n=1 Tax=Sphingomonas sp. TaxID=28214 RepID=UPI001D1FB49F|nr:asparagine synthase (glutamine-hydrolyzing) [Sphingomonas sp.]MBX9796729.1 asparagine synthase (glutamine-hydrolyzing) [Sphingomonas sp.]